jgi:DNA-binding NtrC family response regulator
VASSLRRAGERLSGVSMDRKHTYATKTQLETLVRRMHRTGILYKEALEEFRRQFILVVLRDVNWNKSKAARVLEMHRSTLVRILRELNIDVRTLPNAERPRPHGAGMPRKKAFAG